MTKEKQALGLWRRWFEEGGDPWIQDDYGRVYCFFCIGEKPSHEPDCIYVKAATLLCIGINISGKCSYCGEAVLPVTL